MGRRKKTPKKSNDDSFDEELAIEIYRKRKSYERPENTGLETVLESEGKDEEKPENSTRVRAQRASKSQQGVQPKLRMINTQPYYLEDDDKTVLRKKQIAKLFKGKDREAFRTLVESLVQMTTFISRIFLKLVELQFKVPISAE